jgi:CheY-like chemotaxis protein
VAKTLLAVDDSVTMRKVLEITFSGEDFRVITAENAQSALGKLGENPGIFVVDTVLAGGEDGYALAKELRMRNPSAPILMLASRYAPYDAARGREAGADDWADKPFDTQQLLDKVRKVVLAKESGGSPAAVEPPRAPPPQAFGSTAAFRAQPAPQPAPQPPPQAAPQPPPPTPAPAEAAQNGFSGTSPGVGRMTQQSLGNSASSARTGTGTLVFGESPEAPAVHPDAPPRPRPVNAIGPGPAASFGSSQALPAQSSPAGASPRPAEVASVASAAAEGNLAGKLGGLGLSPAQADAVLALSRELVERVVWEVVPQLAETMIREEIERLTKS